MNNVIDMRRESLYKTLKSCSDQTKYELVRLENVHDDSGTYMKSVSHSSFFLSIA